jgi:hypothetical protein
MWSFGKMCCFFGRRQRAEGRDGIQMADGRRQMAEMNTKGSRQKEGRG